MACQKVAAGGVVVSGQIADSVLADGFGRGQKRAGMKGGWRCDGNADKENGIVLLVRMVFCCVRPLEGCWGLGGAGCELTSIAS